VQSTLSTLLTQSHALDLRAIAGTTSRNVARRFNIPRKGRIAVGFDADLTLVALNESYELTREMLLDRHKLSPFAGARFRGRIRRTLVRGQTVFHEGAIVRSQVGRLLTPQA
jgi:allantoinase